jgi:hypothetical protein
VLASVLYRLVLCVPVAVAVAVLRYRLWDLDRLISRTVTYALVTGLLVVPYLLILPVVTRLAGDAGSLAVAAATLAVAAGFQPLPPGPGPGDSRFNRRRYDAARTVERFATRLREQVDLDALSAELLAVVEQSVQPGPGVVVATPAGHPTPAVAQPRPANTTVTYQPNTQGPVRELSGPSPDMRPSAGKPCLAGHSLTAVVRS